MSRKLDAAIAEAMGREVVWYVIEGISFAKVDADYPGAKPFYADTLEPVKRFSEDGNVMLELDAEMRTRGSWLSSLCYLLKEKIFQAEYAWFKDGVIKTAMERAEKEEIARALAAYRALTGKEWVEVEIREVQT